MNQPQITFGHVSWSPDFKAAPLPIALLGSVSLSGAPPCSASGIEAEVCNDVARRQRIGMNKYGVTVADNPLDLRQWLQHAYEECLDQAVYLRRAISELDAQNAHVLPQGDS